MSDLEQEDRDEQRQEEEGSGKDRKCVNRWRKTDNEEPETRKGEAFSLR